VNDHQRPGEAPPEPPGQLIDEDELVYCYGHPDTPTRLRCSRCSRPICGRCAIPATVGQHCPWCVAEARKSRPKVRSAIRAAAPATMTILAINVAAFLIQQLFPGVTERFFLFEPSIAAGEWWRLLTPMILHGGALHLLLNSFVLWIYGPDVEQAFGTPRFLALYLVGGFMGSVGSYAFGPCPQPSVGASGAIFGIVGALLVYLFRRRDSAMIQQYMRGIIGFVVINLLFGFVLSASIDNFAHIGGLLGGALVGFGVDKGNRTTGSIVTQVLWVVAIVALGLVILVARTPMLEATCF
jgi:membrane associated rhomboid family serine protease